MMKQMIVILKVVLKGNNPIPKDNFFSLTIRFTFYFRSLDCESSEEHPETGEPEVKKLKNSD